MPSFRERALARLEQSERTRADRIARQCANAGFARTLGVDRTNMPADPKRGGSTGYPVWFRVLALEFARHTSIEHACECFDVSLSSIYRWSHKLEPRRQNGNHQKEILTGEDQLLLTIAIYVHPTASIDEICAFIANHGGGIFTRQQVSRRLKELNITRKKASVEAYAAFTPRNLLKARMFWTAPPPLGILTVHRCQLLDIDETRFSLVKIRTKYGWSVRAVRVRDTGEYRRGQSSVNLIIGIEPGNPMIPNDLPGSIKNPRRWFRITDLNCDQHLFADFIDEICTSFEERPQDGDHERYFMFDNLSAHLTPLVHSTLELRPTNQLFKFKTLVRPPYQPKFGPIEYIIGQISSKIAKMHKRNWTVENLTESLHNICRDIGRDGSANDTFAFVGYPP